MIKYGTYTHFLCKKCGAETDIPLGAEKDAELEKTSSVCGKHDWITIGAENTPTPDETRR